MDFSEKDKKFLLNLARNCLDSWLKNKSQPPRDEKDISPPLLEKRGTYVSIFSGKHLWGCAGHVDATQPIYKDVIENSLAAAFGPGKSKPLTKTDLGKINIKISIFGALQKIDYDIPERLIQSLEIKKHGVFVKKGVYEASFAPEVWAELKTGMKFLTQLCLKAGLGPLEWRAGDLLVYTFNTISFSE